MKKLTYILLIAFAITLGAPIMDAVCGTDIVALCAADNRAKEREKAAKAREKEKAKKAKEREKAAKAREKEKAKRAKEAAKKKAQQQKAQQQKAEAQQKAQAQNSSSAKVAPTKPQNNNLSAAEEKALYMEQAASIIEANEKAEAYNNRDIEHRLGLWGQIGYSNLFTSSISYDKDANTGFVNSDKGYVGGGVGLGYQLRYKRAIVTTGLEFMTYNSVMGFSGADKAPLTRTFQYDPGLSVSYDMQYTYSFSEMQDKLIGGFIQLPITAGMEHRNVPIFWQAGLKLGLGVLGQSTVSGMRTTTIKDNELIEDLVNLYTHDLVTDDETKHPTTKVGFGFNLAATAEVGVNLDQWITAPVKMRASLFVDYGLLNVSKRTVADGAQDLPMQLANANTPLLDYPVNSTLATTSAANATVNPFLVGAKVAIWFGLPRPPKPMQKMPKEPNPRLGVYLYDAETAAALGGVSVEIASTETGKTQTRTTNKQGLVQGRFPVGRYTVAATKNGYFPSDTVTTGIESFTFDTLRLALTRVPEPILPTLCLNIYDGETKQPVEAASRFTSLNDTTTLFAAQSSDDGFIETSLLAGDYLVHVTAMGYMSKDDTLHFVEDTLNVYLTRIKEGIKVKINNLFFATNKTRILPMSEQSMNDLAQFLLENPTVTILITGHTDAVGSDEANQKLSEGRANAVREDLIKRGVAAERLAAEGKGESQPVDTNDTEEGRQNNRRVEFVITGTDGEDIQQVY